MSTWDEHVFTLEENVDFLDDLSTLDDEDVVEAVHDAVVLGSGDDASDDEYANGLAAATIAAIWSGAPFTAGDVIEEYPFIRSIAGFGDERLNEKALELLEGVDTSYDLEPFTEALS